MTEERTPEDRPPDAARRVADDPRLQPPPLRSDILPRPRLLQRLDHLGDARIVAVVAPAGYGKTTFLAQWRAAEHRPVAWVTLDGQCADPTVLVDLISASVGAAVGETVEATGVPRLAAAVHRLGRPMVLLLDDVHSIEGTAGLDALATLIGYLPTSAVVGFAGRSTAGLPITRWAASGLTVELDERDLALHPPESIELVRRVDPSLDERRARDLHDQTEGWPAAVYLATRSRPPAGVVRASGMAGVDEYLRRELFDASDAATRTFLLHTAILDRLTGGLCDAVTGGRGSGALLARLATSHHLITPLDVEGRWYRVRGLLRGYLLHRLERDGADVSRLHRRAAAWLTAHGHADTAVEHLLAAGDATAAADVATDLALPLIRDGRIATLDRWMTHFGADELAAHPELTATAAVSAILRGDVERSRTLAAILEHVRADPGLIEGARGAGAGAVVRALMARGGLEAAYAEALAATEHEPPHSAWYPIVLATAGGLAAMLERGADADRLLTTALGSARTQNAGRAYVGVLAFQSIVEIRRDAWARAEALARDAVATTATSIQEREATGALAFAVAARCTAHRGDLGAARRHLTSLQGASVSLTGAAPWLSVMAIIEGARASLALSDPSGARTLLRHADSIVAGRPELGDLADRIHTLQARIRSLPPGVAGASTLTPAEIRVLLLLPTYLSMPEIAERLVVSPNTVRTQVQSIYGKLGASSRAEAVDRAVEAGLLEPLPILAAI